MPGETEEGRLRAPFFRGLAVGSKRSGGPASRRRL